ncbi:hypothetical protein C8R44DRAFT_858380 [Mycena epipterygia]|nr:hypothetical protein C8R44DRAFT_858380 [Mycena epipterygia]
MSASTISTTPVLVEITVSTNAGGGIVTSTTTVLVETTGPGGIPVPSSATSMPTLNPSSSVTPTSYSNQNVISNSTRPPTGSTQSTSTQSTALPAATPIGKCVPPPDENGFNTRPDPVIHSDKMIHPQVEQPRGSSSSPPESGSTSALPTPAEQALATMAEEIRLLRGQFQRLEFERNMSGIEGAEEQPPEYATG